MVRICKAGDQLPVCVSLLPHEHFPGCRTLENVQANSAQFVNIWVVDLCQEANLWRSHWVVVGKEKFELEYAS
jgi:hypothetical protein